MATFSSTIEEARRILMPRPPMSVNLLAAYTAGQATITLDYNNPMFNAVRAGSLLSVDLELMYVTADPNTSTGVTNVSTGYYGSTNANHAITALAEVSPRFSRFEVAQFVNEEIGALASPDIGLGVISAQDATFIPVFAGYDLGGTPTTGGAFDGLRSRVLAVSYRIAPPIRTYPPLRRDQYRIIRAQNPANTDFPSGNGIIIYQSAWPGFPIHVVYTAPYTPLVNLSDDLLTVGNIPTSQQDIVYMGAVLRAAGDREIQRNSMEWQPDPRKAAEVPPGAMSNSVGPMRLRYLSRLNSEASYYKRAYPQGEFAR